MNCVTTSSNAPPMGISSWGEEHAAQLTGTGSVPEQNFQKQVPNLPRPIWPLNARIVAHDGLQCQNKSTFSP